MLTPLFPETASDKNKSVLAAVLRRPLPKTLCVENFSHKSSILLSPKLFYYVLSPKLEQQLERQPREGIKSHRRPPPSRNSLAQK